MEYIKKNNIIDEYFPDYYTYWSTSLHKKGYSGVSIFSKIPPLKCVYGLKSEEHDSEGRIITLEYENYYLVSVYVPNSGEGLKRLEYRVDSWDSHFFKYLKKLRNKKNVVIAGDFNVAHKEIDIYASENKDKQPGFTLQERNSFSNLLNSGFIDTFREKYPNERKYTFWAPRAFARQSNSGWRIDYILVDDKNNFHKKVKESKILDHYEGSDHCPIKITLI